MKSDHHQSFYSSMQSIDGMLKDGSRHTRKRKKVKNRLTIIIIIIDGTLDIVFLCKFQVFRSVTI
jgi:hypothetical protein